jgi:hypothetical protein
MTATPSMSVAAESQLPCAGRNREDAVAVVASRRSSAADRPRWTPQGGRSGCTGMGGSHGDHQARGAGPRVAIDEELEASDGAGQTEEGSPW